MLKDVKIHQNEKLTYFNVFQRTLFIFSTFLGPGPRPRPKSGSEPGAGRAPLEPGAGSCAQECRTYEKNTVKHNVIGQTGMRTVQKP